MGDATATRAKRSMRSRSSGEAILIEEERQIEKLLTDESPKEAITQWGLNLWQSPEDIPIGFKWKLRQYSEKGRLPRDVENYYFNLPRGDSRNFPDHNGGTSLLRSVLKQDAASDKNSRKEGRWKPGQILGKGGYGSVILWERQSRYGPVQSQLNTANVVYVLIWGQPMKLATKDAVIGGFFGDYCSEAQVTRRLNDVGCRNVIKVLDWGLYDFPIESKPIWRMTAQIRPDPEKKSFFRIAYEFAEHGDLFHLYWFYRKHGYWSSSCPSDLPSLIVFVIGSYSRKHSCGIFFIVWPMPCATADMEPTT